MLVPVFLSAAVFAEGREKKQGEEEEEEKGEEEKEERGKKKRIRKKVCARLRISIPWL